MAKIFYEHSNAKFHKTFHFREGAESPAGMTVKVKTTAELTGEQAGKVKDALDDFVKKLKAIAEEF